MADHVKLEMVINEGNYPKLKIIVGRLMQSAGII